MRQIRYKRNATIEDVRKLFELEARNVPGSDLTGSFCNGSAEPATPIEILRNRKRAENLDFYRTHNRRRRDRDMIRSIFTRDKPGTSDPAVAEAMADGELKFGDTVPTGTYLDMTTRLPLVDPLKVKAPVLIVRGEYDGIATEDDLLSFFRKLPVPDREFAILPGASHSIALGLNRRQFWHVTRSFLEMPQRIDVQTSINGYPGVSRAQEG